MSKWAFFFTWNSPSHEIKIYNILKTVCRLQIKLLTVYVVSAPFKKKDGKRNHDWFPTPTCQKLGPEHAPWCHQHLCHLCDRKFFSKCVSLFKVCSAWILKRWLCVMCQSWATLYNEYCKWGISWAVTIIICDTLLTIHLMYRNGSEIATILDALGETDAQKVLSCNRYASSLQSRYICIYQYKLSSFVKGHFKPHS